MANDTIKLKVDVDTTSGEKSIEALDKELKGLDKSFDDLSTGVKSSSEGMIDLGKVGDTNLKKVNKTLSDSKNKVDGLGEATKKSKTGFNGMTTGIKGIGTAIKGAGIGLLLGIIAGLFNLLKQNQGVMDFMNKAVKTMEILFANLLEAIKPLKETLTNAFSDPKQAVIDLWNVIKENLMNRVTGLIDFYKQSFSSLVNIVKGAGFAISGMFSDEDKKKSEDFFAAAKKDALAAGESFIQVTTGVDNLVGKMVDGYGNIKETVTAATQAADEYIKRQNEMKIAESELNKYIAKNKSTIADLKLVRDDENASMKERIEAANKINELVDEEERRAIALQQEKINLMNLDKELTQTTTDDLVAINNAEAELDNLRTNAATRQRENQMKMAALSNKVSAETIAETKEVTDAKIKAEEERVAAVEKAAQDKKDAEQELQDYINELEGATKEAQLEKIETEAEELEELYESKLLSHEAYLIRKQELEDEANALSVEATEITSQDKWNIAQAALQASSKLLNAYQGFIEDQMNDELEAAEGNEAAQEMIREKYGEKKKSMAKASILMDAASAIIGTWAGYSTMGIPGTIIAGIQTATIAGLAIAQIAKVNSAKYEQGGILSGPSHAQGGIQTPYGELEGGEGVINNTSMSNASLRNMASAANVGGNGRDFSTGDGSIKLSPDSIAMITNGINDKKVYVSETDITETQNKVSVVEQESIL